MTSGPKTRGGRAVRRLASALFAALFIVAAPAVRSAELAAAVEHYRSGNFTTARPEMEELAALGDPVAQAIFGQMLVRGEGGPTDTALGFGWQLASAENGYKGTVDQADTLRANLASMSAAERRPADDVRRRYGINGLAQRLLPRSAEPEPCSGVRERVHSHIVEAEYPLDARFGAQDAVLFVLFKVGVDGHAREPQVLGAFPSGDIFSEPVIEAILKSRFDPATVDGHAVETVQRLKYSFRITDGGNLWDSDKVRTVRKRAAEGNPFARFAVGSAALADPAEFRLSKTEALDFVVKAAQAGVARAQYWVSTELALLAPCRDPEKSTRWLEAAARNDEPAAQVELARRLLAGAPPPEARVHARRLLAAAADSKSEFAKRLALGILATTPLDDVRAVDLAGAAARKLRIEEYDSDPLSYEAVAAAYAATGAFDEAIKKQERAVRLGQKYKWDVTAMTERLASYQTRNPWQGDLLAAPTH